MIESIVSVSPDYLTTGAAIQSAKRPTLASSCFLALDWHFPQELHDG